MARIVRRADSSYRVLLALALVSGTATCTSDNAAVMGTVQSEQLSPDGSVKVLVSMVGTGATDVDVAYVYLRKVEGGAVHEIMRTNGSGMRISWVSKDELRIVVPCGAVLNFNNRYYVMRPEERTVDHIVRIVLTADGPVRCEAGKVGSQ